MLFLVSPFAGFSQSKIDAEKATSIEVVINGDVLEISSIPNNGRVEVYSIIGSKVASFTVRDGIASEQLTLPKGYYILKTANSTKKIAVK